MAIDATTTRVKLASIPGPFLGPVLYGTLILAILVFLAVIFMAGPQHRGVATAFMVLLALPVVFNEYFRHRRPQFRCPGCRGDADEPLEADAGAPLLRYCQHCNVLWQVGEMTP